MLVSVNSPLPGRTCKCLLHTNVLHKEAVILIRVGDVVAAELHAVGGPNRGVVFVKKTLPVRMDIFGTLPPFGERRAEMNNRVSS